jgi:fatty acid desaturase
MHRMHRMHLHRMHLHRMHLHRMHLHPTHPTHSTHSTHSTHVETTSMSRELYGLTRDEIRGFTRPSSLAGAYAIGSTWLVIAATFVALAYVPWLFPLAVVVLGGRQLALAVIMHDQAHHTLFRSRSRVLDHVVDLTCAAPVLADVTRYRRHHLGHHAHTGTERDPDLYLAPVEPMSTASFRRKVVRDLVGVTGLRRIVGLTLIDLDLLAFNVGGEVIRAPRRGFAHHARAGLRNLTRPIVTNVALALLLGWIYLAWVVAYLTVFSLVVRLRSLAEHAGMDRTADPLRNTRTTYATVLARMTVAPLNVNYHLEHHLLPTVPWFRLPALHRAIATTLPTSSIAPSYRAVLDAITR